MVRVLFRADDLGYSEGINYGIEKSVKEGLITNVGVMVNMPATEHGVNLIKDCEIAFGLHTNICIGQPLTDSHKVSSIVTGSGQLKSSKEYRSAEKDFVVFDEVVLEVEAQYQKFLNLFGRKPDYLEGHAVASVNFFKALEYVASVHSVKYSGMPDANEAITIGNSQVYLTMKSLEPNYDPLKTFQEMVKDARPNCVELMVFHPGYLDDFILKNSSLLIPRAVEVEMLISPQLKGWLKDSQVECLTYKDL